MEPVQPANVDPFARAFLARLQERPEADRFVLGGYFALQHYLDYRETHDIAVWWRGRVDAAALQAAREAFAEPAREFGYTMRERSWGGEIVSFEALHNGSKVFSFQIALRTIELAEPTRSPWGRIPLESLDDNIGAKMTALVNRGAPRDFVDIKAIVDARLATSARCWELWRAKNPGATIDEGRLALHNHLASLAARLPIERIPQERRASAQALREWFRDEFTAAGDGGQIVTVIDGSLYPDVPVPVELAADGDRADYVLRVCAAWDYGIPPEPETVALLRDWRRIFDAFPSPRSRSYHAFRAFFAWPAIEIPPTSILARWEELDALEERDDPARSLV